MNHSTLFFKFYRTALVKKDGAVSVVIKCGPGLRVVCLEVMLRDMIA